MDVQDIIARIQAADAQAEASMRAYVSNNFKEYFEQQAEEAIQRIKDTIHGKYKGPTPESGDREKNSRSGSRTNSSS